MDVTHGRSRQGFGGLAGIWKIRELASGFQARGPLLFLHTMHIYSAKF
jgi:hypothetical protein